MKTQSREEEGWSQKDQNLFANTDALGKCRVGSTKECVVSIQQKDGFKFILNKKTGDSWNARE